MEFLSAILGLVPCLYDQTSKHTVYIRDLKKNLHALSKEMNALNNLYEDVKARVEREEQRQMIRRKEVGGWIDEVEGLEKEVEEILGSGNQEILKRCYARNCWSSYKIGKEVSEKLVAVSDLIGKGHFDVVAEMLPRPIVDELPMEETVGSEFTYDKICTCLKDPQVGLVGLYGMGGVGKTTLLKKINNDFLTTTSSSRDFDVVIWVVVSKPSDFEKVQLAIWNKLQIPLDVWENRSSKEEKAVEILRVLKTKKFLVLMDDIWERIDLLEIGIPRPDSQNKSKVVFTTRSLDVCHRMKAHKKIEVTCLSPKAAWTLFQNEVGEETLKSHPHVPKLAMTVTRECNGLPLALVTLGRAMAGENDPSNWDKVIQDLTKFPAEISGMEDELFHRLKVSYDRLSDDVTKSCFTFCSLFSKDWETSNDRLVELWMGEGFLGEVHDIHKARDQGHKIIKNLKHACLLESCGSKEIRVRMHDVIHDMTLWLYGECGKKKNKILVYNDVSGLEEGQEIQELEETEKMSVWDRNVEMFPKTMVCPNLKTLIVMTCNKLKKFPSGFFQFMPLLRVLNLSDNENLVELPAEIGEMVTLRYLNLSHTKIRELPIELKNLKNLMILLMNGLISLEVIPQGVISSLTSLKLFDLYGAVKMSGAAETLLEELDSLKNISEISIIMPDTLSFNKLKSSHKLQRCISHLLIYKWLDVISLELSSSILKRMEHMQRLCIYRCYNLKEVKIGGQGEEKTQIDLTLPKNISSREKYFHTLCEVNVGDCHYLLDLTWLVHAPCLELLYVRNCKSMEEVIRDDDDDKVCEMKGKWDIFSRIKHLRLQNLPRLKSICHRPLLFPSLETIKVYKCQSLRSLPFDSNTSMNNMRKIKGEKCWWNQLEWSDESVKHSCAPYFQIYEVPEVPRWRG